MNRINRVLIIHATNICKRHAKQRSLPHKQVPSTMRCAYFFFGGGSRIEGVFARGSRVEAFPHKGESLGCRHRQLSWVMWSLGTCGLMDKKKVMIEQFCPKFYETSHPQDTNRTLSLLPAQLAPLIWEFSTNYKRELLWGVACNHTIPAPAPAPATVLAQCPLFSRQ